MRWHAIVGLIVLSLAVLCCTAAAELREGIKLQADGKDIDVRVGHLVPTVTDWNGDGKKDLVVGQFLGGKIRVYLNNGTDKAPVLKDFSLLRAENKEIRLPAG